MKYQKLKKMITKCLVFNISIILREIANHTYKKTKQRKFNTFNCILYCCINEKAVGKLSIFPKGYTYKNF